VVLKMTIQMHDDELTVASADKASSQSYDFGPRFYSEGVEFRLWAPHAHKVDLVVAGAAPVAMDADGDGWFRRAMPGLGAGARYRFLLDDELDVPDPASRFQPEDVAGPSEVIDTGSFAWSRPDWTGRAWEELVIYEVHLGTFTAQGTFRAAIERLDHLVALGVTAIEIMPVASFPGARNWGYDGAMLYAPDAAYGRPEDFRALVDACHARGLCVVLDVVYNHFGPEGNYFSAYAPLFTDKHQTPWGAAINYDDAGSAGVRRFILENALYWLTEYRLDGLRFDAVHEIRDEGSVHFLDELTAALRAALPGRQLHLIAENAHNQAGWMKRDGAGKPLYFSAQWNDDVHHALHVAGTGERSGYYADYADPVAHLARALAQGFSYQGEITSTQGEPRGEPSAFLPPSAFVCYLQNHDQVGNRAFGERITALAPAPVVRALAAIYLLSPQIPLLFMGEEWAASQPFLYFSDIQSLAEDISKHRREEFAEFYADTDEAPPPDAMTQEAFTASTLDWSEPEAPGHAEWLAFYRTILAVRRTEIVPRLFGMAGHCGRHEVFSGRAMKVSWRLGDGTTLELLANLSNEPLENLPCWEPRQIWLQGHASATGLGPWSVVWRLA